MSILKLTPHQSFGIVSQRLAGVLTMLIGLALTTPETLACTTAVISGRATPDGRPILWKLRDTETLRNHIQYYEDGAIPYVAMVNSDSTAAQMVWGGCNQAGFAIMNSASFNTNLDHPTRFRDQEGVVMKWALMYCRNLADFEHMLDTLRRPMGLNSNFGVIDASGGAAYYETDNTHYEKFDANDPTTAPFGYLIRTNFSFMGRSNTGYGFIRYQRAEEVIGLHASSNTLTPELFISTLSRDMRNPLTGADYNQYQSPLPRHDMQSTADMLCRHGTASNIVVVGVRPEESPRKTVLWGNVAFPLTTVSLPAWPVAGGQAPITGHRGTSELSRLGLARMWQCYPVTRGSGSRYIDLSVLRRQGQGPNALAERILSLEGDILRQTQRTEATWGKEPPPPRELKELLNRLEDQVRKAYTEF